MLQKFLQIATEYNSSVPKFLDGDYIKYGIDTLMVYRCGETAVIKFRRYNSTEEVERYVCAFNVLFGKRKKYGILHCVKCGTEAFVVLKQPNIESKKNGWELDEKIALFNAEAQEASLTVGIEADIQRFDSQIARINIDVGAVETAMLQLKKEYNRLKANAHRETSSTRKVVLSIESTILSYLSGFGITDPKASDLFTSDLKALGGTGLHLIVFAFRLAYVKVIRDQVGCVLPIVIDSPHGREVKNEVVEKMLEVLVRDFKQHQIIIATIFDPKIKGEEIIQLTHGVFGDGSIFSFKCEDEKAA